MKLLFDANLSRRIIPLLVDLFPNSAHVSEFGLDGQTPDHLIFECGRENGFTIVTADSDFLELVNRFGIPPKIVRLDRMDYSTKAAEEVIRRNAIALA